MTTIHTGSDLIEVTFTPHEKNTAMQLTDKGLSIMYLQNTKVQILRQLAMQVFEKPEDDEKEQRMRAYLRGQHDILDALITGALEPEPIPISGDGSTSPESPI